MASTRCVGAIFSTANAIYFCIDEKMPRRAAPRHDAMVGDVPMRPLPPMHRKHILVVLRHLGESQALIERNRCRVVRTHVEPDMPDSGSMELAYEMGTYAPCVSLSTQMWQRGDVAERSDTLAL